MLTATTITAAALEAPAVLTPCFSPLRFWHRSSYSWLFYLGNRVQGGLNPLWGASQPQRNKNNSKIHHMKLQKRPPPFLHVLSGGLKHHGLKCACSLGGRAHPRARTQLVTISKWGKQKWQGHWEECRATRPPHIACHAAEKPSRCHQQEACPEVLSNSLLIRVAKSHQWFLLSLKLIKIHSKSSFLLLLFVLFNHC